MFVEKTEIENIDKAQLAERISKFKNDGFRLFQISCTTLKEDFEIIYSFEKDYNSLHLRVIIPKTLSAVESITPIYPMAFIYENELQDLFGIKVSGLTPNFNGKFYRTSIKTPFAVPLSGKSEE